MSIFNNYLKLTEFKIIDSFYKQFYGIWRHQFGDNCIFIYSEEISMETFREWHFNIIYFSMQQGEGG